MSSREKAFGKHVKSLRRARGLTQEELALDADLSADTIRRLEAGVFSPSLITLTKLCRGLSLRLSTLFESFELDDDGDLRRELADLICGRSPREIEEALNVLRAFFAGIDALRK